MEESLSLLGAIRKKFVCDRVDIRTYSPLTLAFVGDCIYDLVIRTIVVERGNTAPGVLHTKKSSIVKAQAQAAQADALMEELTAEEQAVYRRGRNAHSQSAAKNASLGDYRKATGLEALYGFLYLTDQTDRLLWLIAKGLELTGQQI